MAGRAASRVLAVIFLAGAAALAAVAARETTHEFDADPWVRMLEGRLRETGAALHARVATLSEIPLLAAAVSTDEQTVRDLTQDELAFRPGRRETIAIGQLPRRGNGAPVVLLAFPDRAHAPPIHPLGRHLAIDADGLVVTEAIRVVPRERTDELDGVVAAGRSVDLEDFSGRLRAAGIGGHIIVGDRDLSVGTRDPSTDAHRLDRPIEAIAGASVQLQLFAPPERGSSPFWGGAGALALGALLFAIRARRSGFAPVLPPANLPTVWSPRAPGSSTSMGLTPVATTVVIEGTGQRIGRYEIVGHLGTGGMAEVCLAHATGEAGFTKKIALKVLSSDFAAQPQLVDQFLDEARLASLLDHPNIVQIIDLGVADGAYFIAMEYVDGADVRRLLDLSHRQGRQIPVAVVIAILRRICDGLHAAHTARAPDGNPLNVVHRDVKSANVFVARNGAVKIGDFGIAKATHASRITRTESGQVKGTPGYMAPEHRMGLPIDGRADQYGVGAIAYEMLSGLPVNLDFMQISQKGKDGWPHLVSLSRFRDDVSPELEAAVFRALAYEAQDRFADCAALDLTLGEIAKRHPPIADDKTIARWVQDTLSIGMPGAAAGSPAQSGGREA